MACHTFLGKLKYPDRNERALKEQSPEWMPSSGATGFSRICYRGIVVFRKSFRDCSAAPAGWSCDARVHGCGGKEFAGCGRPPKEPMGWPGLPFVASAKFGGLGKGYRLPGKAADSKSAAGNTGVDSRHHRSHDAPVGFHRTLGAMELQFGRETPDHAACLLRVAG